MKQSLAVTLFAAIALVGCSGGDGEPQAAPSPSVSASPSPSPASRARVSLATVCPDLFEHQQAAADLVTEFVDDAQALADGRASTTARFDAVIADLNYDASIAPLELVPFIEQQIATMRELRSYLQTGGERTSHFRDFRSSGLELVNQCGRA